MDESLAFDGGLPPGSVGGKRRRILDQLKRNLRHHPGTAAVRFEESGTGTDWRLVTDLALSVLLNENPPVNDAELYVNWWPHPDPTPDQFKIHYVESSGFDCGWHRQENDHVAGLDHYQERHPSDAEYTYEPADFDHENPVGILWETLDEKLLPRLRRRVESSRPHE
ncbi:hypothetical protein [Halorussus ruber]|uniref:hypothetical protein n=1 Tax=Halorussus ruber TaxID=1126238 RepID=UPI00109302CA|nr:hypothetical protein [Halorussus ruber]